MVRTPFHRRQVRTLAVVVIALGPVPPAVAGDLPTLDTIRRETADVWDKMAARGWAVDSESEIRPGNVNPQGQAANRYKVRSLWKPPHYLWVRELTGGEPPSGNAPVGRAQVRNPRYEFNLARRTPGATDWALMGWKKTDAASEPGYAKIVDDPGFLDVGTHLSVAGRLLPTFLAGDGITVTAPAASPDNPGTVRLGYSGRTQPRPDVSTAVSGWADLDPSAGWSVRESNMRSVETFAQAKKTMTFVVRSRCDVELDADGLPVLRKVEAQSGIEGQPLTIGSVVYNMRSVPTIADADFRLPAFGLPEPEGMAPPGTPTYLWVIAAALVSGGLTAVFYRLAARRRTP